MNERRFERRLEKGLSLEESGKSESKKNTSESRYKVNWCGQTELASIALLATERALTNCGRFMERESLGRLGVHFISSWLFFVPGQWNTACWSHSEGEELDSNSPVFCKMGGGYHERVGSFNKILPFCTCNTPYPPSPQRRTCSTNVRNPWTIC